MASIHRAPNSPNWYCAFTTPDGVRRFKSTKTGDKKSALEICRIWEKASREGKQGKLSPDRAREIISSGVAEVYSVSVLEELPSANLKGWVKQWLESKSIALTESSYSRYERIALSFIDFIGKKAEKDLSTIQASDVAKWRDHVSKSLSASTANLSLKCLRVCFNDAIQVDLITKNPASKVKLIEKSLESQKRQLTIPEIKRVLEACDEEWRGMVLFALYIGQRISDIRGLTWQSVDLVNWTLKLVTQKTKRRMELPLVKPLQDYLLSIKSSDNPQTPLFPRAFATKRVGTLSNQFREILTEAGLVAPRSHKAEKGGRSGKREVSEISFHSLRHSAVTFLKAAGVSDVMAREIIGHESSEVSRNYTHLSVDDMRNAIQKITDVTL